MGDETIGYAEAMDELEQILDELEGDDLDVDVLAVRVRRASELIELCRTRITRAATVSRRALVTSRAKAMFSVAVRSSSSRKSWNTMPIRRLSAERPPVDSLATFSPNTKISPRDGLSDMNNSRKSVVLPAPDGPVRK